MLRQMQYELELPRCSALGLLGITGTAGCYGWAAGVTVTEAGCDWEVAGSGPT
jgi:hypothetical protein